jgi:hypothetical protein
MEQNAPILTFDDGLGQYYLGSRPIPRISDFMNLIRDFSMVDPETLRYKQKYGTALHKYLELVDLGKFVSGDERLYPHIESWIKFKKEEGLDEMKVLIEQINHHPILLYGGRPDRRYYDSDGNLRIIVELKSSEPSFKTGIQLAAQAGMEISNKGRGIRLIEASFNKAGKLRPQAFKFEPNWRDFLCVHRVFKLKNQGV